MLTFPTLYTTRLKLRKLAPEDIPLLVQYANNKKISDQVKNIPHPYTEPDAVFRISYVWHGFKAKARYVFAITLKDTDELVGEIGLHMDSNGKVAQLGYWIAEPHWDNGYASEAVERIVQFGLEALQLETIFATVHQDNPASAKVLLNNGMVLTGNSNAILQYSLTR